MSFLDKVGNRVDKMKSKQSENSDINSYNKQIKEEKDAIDLMIVDIGMFYWKEYAEGRLESPPAELADTFKEIQERVERRNELMEKIEQRKKEGIEQRNEIDINTKATEERKAAEAAERKRQREEAKRIAAEEKAAEKVTSEDDDQL